MTSPRIIAVFLKYPRPGGVKTRLAAGLTGEDAPQQAVEIYKNLVATVFRILSKSDFDQLQILFDPPGAEDDIRAWLEPHCEDFPESINVKYVSQNQGDLGDRLMQAIHDAHENPGAKVAAIGTDCVELSPEIISQLWQELEENDIVFGPTHDGGYYLVGTGRKTPEIFTDVPWSSEETLSVSLDHARAAGRQVALLDTLNDVDTVEDWEIARKRIAEIG